MNLTQKELAKYLARELRKNQTPTETKFWELVRNRGFDNHKFYRQKILFYKYNGKRKFFIADFYCHEKKMIIEIDGGIHQKQKEYDHNRDEIIKTLDLTVVRFTNEEIENNIDEVFSKLERILKSLSNKRGM